MFIAVVQFNPKVGALRENCERALAKIDELAALPYPPDLVVFPAFALTGAELGGLVVHSAFAAEALDVAHHFMAKAALPTLIGTVLPRPVAGSTRFTSEEEVLFAMGGKGSPLGFLDLNNGIEFQEYVESVQMRLGGTSLCVVLDDFVDPDANYGDAEVIICMTARSYQDTSALLTASGQIDSLRTDAITNNAWVVVANLCGGEDAYVFEGGSIVVAPNGSVVESAPPFEEHTFTVNLSRNGEYLSQAELSAVRKSDTTESGVARKSDTTEPASMRQRDKKRVRPLLPYEADWRALTTGLRDYVQKNGFEEVVLGLSGGIDSAVCATLAVDALGATKVHGVLMPSEFSTPGSITHAEALAERLGISTQLLPIKQSFDALKSQYEEALGARTNDVALQNLQARLRMVTLMHLSNTNNWMLLNTGNKSEAAVGYSTLYGDTAGALAPLGNFYKTDVYGLASWRNSREAVIPQDIIDKAPSAELYPGQKDEDHLPPYEVLDQILRLHIEENLGVDEIREFLALYPLETGITTTTILEVLERVRRFEYKRRQEPLAFQFNAVDIEQHRAWPLTNGFVDHSRDLLPEGEVLSYLRNLYRELGHGGPAFLDN